MKASDCQTSRQIADTKAAGPGLRTDSPYLLSSLGGERARRVALEEIKTTLSSVNITCSPLLYNRILNHDHDEGAQGEHCREQSSSGKEDKSPRGSYVRVKEA